MGKVFVISFLQLLGNKLQPQLAGDIAAVGASHTVAHSSPCGVSVPDAPVDGILIILPYAAYICFHC